jgi:hypothetical protein
VLGTAAILWYNWLPPYAMADRVTHRRSDPAAPFGTFAYAFSYRAWRFS